MLANPSDRPAHRADDDERLRGGPARPRREHGRGRVVVELLEEVRGSGPVAVLRDPDFRLLCAASIGVTAAMFVPFVHLAADPAARGPGRRPRVPCWSRRRGARAWPVHRAAAVALIAALLLWLPSGSGVLRLGTFAVVFGLAHGAFVGLSAAVAAERYGTVGLAARLAALHAVAAVGGLVGPAAAGWSGELLGTPVAVPPGGGRAGCRGLCRAAAGGTTGR